LLRFDFMRSIFVPILYYGPAFEAFCDLQRLRRINKLRDFKNLSRSWFESMRGATDLGKVYCGWKAIMAAENLAAVISSLTQEEQESVKQFVDFLKRKGSAPSSPFLAAVEEFIGQHPELLRRLAQ
jgi:hypothetical protein